MEPHKIIFYIFASILVLSALRVITAKNPVHSVLYLILAFVSAASLWILIGVSFLGVALILVYVGAVMVLFLFVVMMLDLHDQPLKKELWKQLPLIFIVIGLITVNIFMLINKQELNDFALSTTQIPFSVKHLALLLFTEYVPAFEVAGLILLLGIVVAIALTLKDHRVSKKQDVSLQIQATKATRLKVVKVAAIPPSPASPAAE